MGPVWKGVRGEAYIPVRHQTRLLVSLLVQVLVPQTTKRSAPGTSLMMSPILRGFSHFMLHIVLVILFQDI